MIFLVSFLYLSFFIFYFPFSFVVLGDWGVLVMTISLCVWCNFYFWNVGCRSLRRDDMASDQFLVTWDMLIICGLNKILLKSLLLWNLSEGLIGVTVARLSTITVDLVSGLFCSVWNRY